MSAIVPTYNPGVRILPTLESFLNVVELPWEVVIVNNSPNLPFHEFVTKAISMLGEKTTVRVIDEEKTGLTNARISGINASGGDILVFVDDDVEVEREFFRNGRECFENGWPNVGLVVSRIYPKYFEGDPDRPVKKREHLLAINYALGEKVIDFPPDGKLAPTVGAALWVKKTAAEEIVRSAALALSDRVGGNLASGGDIEIGFLVGRLGLRRVYSPEVRAHHRIPKSRFATQYFRRLIGGITRSEIAMKKRAGLLSKRDEAGMILRSLMGLLFSPVLFFVDFSTRELVFRWQFALSSLVTLVAKY